MSRYGTSWVCAAVLVLGCGFATELSAQNPQQELKTLDQLEGYDQLKGEKSVKKDVTTMQKEPVESLIVWSEAKPTKGQAPLQVDFSADPVAGATAYTWQFGDGSAGAQGAAVSHTFRTVGIYRVTLTVAGANGALGEDELRIKVTP